MHERVGGRAGGGGGVRQMLELALALRAAGHEVVVACHDFEPGTEFGGASQRVEVRSVRHGGAGRGVGRLDAVRTSLVGMRAVARLVPQDADVVNAHEAPGLRAGAAAAIRTGAPLVWTRNDETFFERALLPAETIVQPSPALRLANATFGLIDLHDARRAAAIVVLDERNASMARRAYGRPVEVVRSGPAARFFDAPDRATARLRLGIDPEAFLVFGFGILFPHRRHEDLIAAAAQLREMTRLRVMIAGSAHAAPAHAAALAGCIDAHAVRDVVELQPEGVSEDELRDRYAAADAYVFPNERQTWGLAPLEALAAGTPVVLSSGAGVHEALRGRPGVRIVPPRRPDAIATALRELHAGAWGGDIEPTRDWLRSELTAERYAARMAALYERSRK